MKFEANKEFMENLSLHTASALASAMIAHHMQSVQWLWSHACSRLYSNISRLVKKFEKYVNHLKKLKPMREKKCPCEWSTSTEFSSFSRKTSCSVPSERLLNFFGHLRILSDRYEKSWHSQDENVTPIKIDGRYRIYPIARQRTSGELKSGDYFLHFSLESAVYQQAALPPPAPIKANRPSPQIIELFHSRGQQLCQ